MESSGERTPPSAMPRAGPTPPSSGRTPSIGPTPPPPAPPPDGDRPARGPVPVTKAERIQALDVLRGFALLGILLVNIHFFRGSDFYGYLAGAIPEPTDADRVADFLVGWLASGKFISSFAILFGLGAAMIAGRVAARGRAPRPVLARRYGWLLVLGLLHMVLLFPGDILFHYGLAGLLLLPFVTVRARTALWWSVGILAVAAVGLLALSALTTITADDAPAAGGASVEAPTTDGASDDAQAADAASVEPFDRFVEDRRDAAIAAYTDGGPLDRIVVRAWESALIQSGQLLLLPWTLALFLFGFAVWRAGVLTDPARRPRLLRRAAAVAVPIGLVLNLPLGWAGPLGSAMGGGEAAAGAGLLLMAVAQTVGAPLLAVGYLASLALACERPAALARLGLLRDAGRMALTGYLLQSLLAVVAFGWFRLYDQLSATAALGVVVVIWAIVLAVAHLTMRRFERGPVEHLWRIGTYGRS
jgi:uncharacterized protein